CWFTLLFMSTFITFFLYCSAPHLYLHSFPTRRSSDLFWMIENAYPLFHFSYHKIRHAGINIVFILTTILVNFSLAFLLVQSSQWATTSHFGVLIWIPDWPLWSRFLIGLLLLDFIGAWLIHWIQHKVKWMWKFHIIHHTDTHVDTTTANRHHPGESVFRF